jgi:hypothetical protein
MRQGLVITRTADDQRVELYENGYVIAFRDRNGGCNSHLIPDDDYDRMRMLVQPHRTKKACCTRDHNMDGNCDIHSAPGVYRQEAFNTVAATKDRLVENMQYTLAHAGINVNDLINAAIQWPSLAAVARYYATHKPLEHRTREYGDPVTFIGSHPITFHKNGNSLLGIVTFDGKQYEFSLINRDPVGWKQR